MDEVNVTHPQFWTQIGTAIVTIASVINMFVGSNGKFGKIINALALGFNKATPDPNKQ